jgi:hypothetical protein
MLRKNVPIPLQREYFMGDRALDQVLPMHTSVGDGDVLGSSRRLPLSRLRQGHIPNSSAGFGMTDKSVIGDGFASGNGLSPDCSRLLQ